MKTIKITSIYRHPIVVLDYDSLNDIRKILFNKCFIDITPISIQEITSDLIKLANIYYYPDIEDLNEIINKIDEDSMLYNVEFMNRLILIFTFKYGISINDINIAYIKNEGVKIVEYEDIGEIIQSPIFEIFDNIINYFKDNNHKIKCFEHHFVEEEKSEDPEITDNKKFPYIDISDVDDVPPMGGFHDDTSDVYDDTPIGGFHDDISDVDDDSPMGGFHDD